MTEADVGRARLLIVHHTPSPAMQEMFDAVLRGATDPEITGVGVMRRPALAATVSDVLAADGYVLGTPANIGYMSGALKHFFDQVFYPILDATRGRPYGLYVHGNLGTEGAVNAVSSIAAGLGWKAVAAPVEITGSPDHAALEACWELGATLAATLAD
jgi:multimeric flavodoxin WrbA